MYAEMLAKDDIMQSLISRHGPPSIGRNPVFTSLVRAVISQQLSDAAASTIFNRLSALTDITPTALVGCETEAFRSCGISTAKAGYIRFISQAALEGQLGNIDHLPDGEVIKVLTKLKGVGRWTAEMILIFALGREDVWPSDDVGLLRAAKNLYGISSVGEFIMLGDRFRPYRSYAAWYLWSSLNN